MYDFQIIVILLFFFNFGLGVGAREFAPRSFWRNLRGSTWMIFHEELYAKLFNFGIGTPGVSD